MINKGVINSKSMVVGDVENKKKEILSKIRGKYLYRERSNLRCIDITCLGKIIDIKDGNYSHPFKVISCVPSNENPLKFVCFNEKECVNLINEHETLKGEREEGILEDCWHRYYLRDRCDLEG